MHTRLLTGSDAGLLAAFVCVMMPRDWESELDDIVRNRLPDQLADGTVHVAGTFDDSGELVAIAAWAPAADRPDTWFSHVLAVRLGRQRRGLGASIKAFVIEQAREAGIRWLISTVHRDNAAMVALNDRIGARTVAHPDDPYRRYFLSVVDLTPT